MTSAKHVHRVLNLLHLVILFRCIVAAAAVLFVFSLFIWLCLSGDIIFNTSFLIHVKRLLDLNHVEILLP